jgi:ABC-type lipoprotein release transport system permease subunit
VGVGGDGGKTGIACFFEQFGKTGKKLGFGVEQTLNAMLFNSGGVDLLAYVVAVPMFLVVTALAAYLPARRACRIAPTQALRYE